MLELANRPVEKLSTYLKNKAALERVRTTSSSISKEETYMLLSDFRAIYLPYPLRTHDRD